MYNLSFHPHPVNFTADITRVIIRPFIPKNPLRVTTILGRALALEEEEVHRQLAALMKAFENRHFNMEGPLLTQFARVVPHLFTQQVLSRERKLLIGALFSGEYALEAAALFNPSMVPHPDQSDVAEGGLRFILSLRATGEGHISSIEFRTGVLSPQGNLQMDPVSRLVSMPEIDINPGYRKTPFTLKLHEMGFDNPHAADILSPLREDFTRSELYREIQRVRREVHSLSEGLSATLQCILWLADSNYEMRFPPDHAMCERAIFPVSANESNGIEDARFVRFTEDDGTVMYYATYTAYNGHAILPQLIETQDFLHFRMLTLNGTAVQNKGMAYFPRRIDGSYAMLSRQDDENLFIMFSNNPHHWTDAQILLRPAELWESVKIGNCGSPIETEAGWILFTHGVGPMRKYCIGAVLLDLNDPTRIIGRLRDPLLEPDTQGREGYVPNVVYSCGGLRHGGDIILPYAMSDRAATIMSIPVEELLGILKT